jgi:heme exporter protein C
MNRFWSWFHRLASPPHFYRWAGSAIPWFWVATAAALVFGTYGALITSPADYQMGEAVRIMYVHVPSAWLSMMSYTVMAVAAAIGLIWRIKLAHAAAAACAPIGAAFTFLALFTGAVWGKPMWGTWWVWDARLTSELVLLFLFLGVIALRMAITETGKADRAAGILAIVGVVNVPIIHYSVYWWTTLHQPASVSRLGKPAVDTSMLIPLLVMTLGFTLFFGAVLLTRTRGEVLDRERNKRWVGEL